MIRVLTDVKMVAELTVRHPRPQQGQELAFAFGKADLAPWPSQRFIDLGVLRPLGENDAFASCRSLDAVGDLLPRYSL